MVKHFLALAFACSIAFSQATAESYPTKPITIVVPFAAGGPNDVLARLVAEPMSRVLNQPVLIENVVGAGGTIGSTRALKAQPDGYTLLSGNLGSLGAAFELYKKLQYRPSDISSIGMIAGTPNFLVVRKDFPAKTLREFIAHAKANPSKVTIGSTGLGSNAHLVCLFLENLTEVEFRHIPYRGTAPAINDLVGGQIDGMCDSAPNVVPQVLGGNVRALVVAQAGRIAAAPDVRSAGEAGLPAFDILGWNALVVPSKTPKEIVAKLSAALKAALNDPATRKRIEDLGAIPPQPAEASPEWMDAFLRSQASLWGKAVKASGVSLD
jgi:tripartite-type tricarboxylate transporter receptor subunit TctC